jgi:hypothetical protein
VTIFTFAPVRLLKSGARRCSGSAICGPVKVSTVTSTPLCRSAPVPWVAWVLLSPPPPLQAATSNDAAARHAAQRGNGRFAMVTSHVSGDRRRPTQATPSEEKTLAAETSDV